MPQSGCPATPLPQADGLTGCDLVMEGGVTSAVIYAAMVSKLSTSHRLHALGGASSGAVAAAAAAIAEAARYRTGNGSAFAKLDAFIERLQAEDDHRTGLRRLFQPAPALLPVFLVVTKALELNWKGRVSRGAVQLVWTLLARFSLAAVFGVSLALATQIGSEFLYPGTVNDAWAIRVLCTLGAALVLAIVAALIAFLCAVARDLPANQLGLCRGRSISGFRQSAHAAVGGLTDELHILFNDLYGRGSNEAPVTFGDLWNPCDDPDQPAGERKVDLQVITTALQLHRPFRIPGDALASPHPLAPFFYDPQEWTEFFPDSVMTWLRDHAPECDLKSPTGATLCALPPPAEWPVLMAARLSLSFPLLLSAVPMYTLWRGHGVVKPRDGSPVRFQPLPVFFSDGGITSNCPVDLFDKPLPRHPTFIINLHQPDKADPTAREQGPRLSTRFSDPESKPAQVPLGGLAAVGDLLRQLVDTSLGWRDSLARTMPGYRERVLNIPVPENLGGLNLCMSGEEIGQLAELGRKGAQTLQSFDRPRDGQIRSGWDQHRWLRLRTALTALSAHCRDLVDCAEERLPAFRALLNSRPLPEPQLVGDEAREEAEMLLDALEKLSAKSAGKNLEQNSPEPLPQLRVQLRY